MNTKADYSGDPVTAARSVMLELAQLLGQYRNHIVIIGGWVPELRYPARGHVGSTDVDLALNHTALDQYGYATIEKLLVDRGYDRDKDRPGVFHRTVVVNGREIKVEVDLMAGEYAGTGKSHRHQNVQDVKARKARGCELAFEGPQEVTISGSLPNGSQDSAKVLIASVVAFVVMKGMALCDRVKEKDAYDIYFCLINHPGGPERLVEEFRPHAQQGLVMEALEKIARKFETVDHYGPRAVVDFLQIADGEERERVQRDAFERVQYLVRGLMAPK